ncbi:MAG: hypothetical protein NTW00_08730 [Hyphomicrobiales bacterium]|jgi:hypothetical protein|nr:hypothetical protein [Hyphomicrobiales bacterium]
MSTSPHQISGAARGNPDAHPSANDAIQQSLTGFPAVPHKLMQINLEAANHAFSFMNRRLKAQAALWSNIGHFSDTSGAAEAQRAFLETVTKDDTEEMMLLTDMARKNLASVTETVSSAPMPGFPAARSS